MHFDRALPRVHYRVMPNEKIWEKTHQDKDEHLRWRDVIRLTLRAGPRYGEGAKYKTHFESYENEKFLDSLPS